MTTRPARTKTKCARTVAPGRLQASSLCPKRKHRQWSSRRRIFEYAECILALRHRHDVSISHRSPGATTRFARNGGRGRKVRSMSNLLIRRPAQQLRPYLVPPKRLRPDWPSLRDARSCPNYGRAGCHSLRAATHRSHSFIQSDTPASDTGVRPCPTARQHALPRLNCPAAPAGT
jgi:hypothetical protein